jgi:hypothetical protein
MGEVEELEIRWGGSRSVGGGEGERTAKGGRPTQGAGSVAGGV